MAKRITDTDMNWNHEDEFKNREIKKAVRRNAGGEGPRALRGEGEGPRALRGFDGLPATTSTTTTATSTGSGSAAPAFLGFGTGATSSFGGLSGLTHANSFTPLTGGFPSPNHTTTTPALALNDPAAAASKPNTTTSATSKQTDGLFSPFGGLYSPLAVTPANANLAPAWALSNPAPSAASKPTVADVTSKQTFDGSSLTRIASNSSISCSSSSIFNNSPSSSSSTLNSTSIPSSNTSSNIFNSTNTSIPSSNASSNIFNSTNTSITSSIPSSNIFNSTSIPSSNTSSNIFNSTNTSITSSIPSSNIFNSTNTSITSSANEDYNRELASLNCAVRDWITQHVDANPLLDLSPVFQDYERHLANIDDKYSGVEELEAEAAAGAAAAGGSATALEGLADDSQAESGEKPPWASLSSSSSSSSSYSSDGTRLFSFGDKDHGRSSPDKSAAAAPPTGSLAVPLLSAFGQMVDTSAAGYVAGTPPHLPAAVPAPPPLPFSSTGPPDPFDKDAFSGGGTPFAFNKNRDTFSSSSIPFSCDKHAAFGPSFPRQIPLFPVPLAFSAKSVALFPLPFGCAGGAIGAETVQPTHDNGANTESDEPPRPEVTEVKETDAFYSKRCKLFYKKESEYKEKGVGTLHLKLTPGGKTQLLVRADTNLGNVLLNIVLQASVPCSRVGKNNVLVVCVPNPSVDDQNPGSALPLLIRVKTTEEADELHKLLEEKKVL